MPSLIYERKLSQQGYTAVAGVDEAGRGPLAGPLVAAAVILPIDQAIPGLDDSKQLSAKQRNALYKKIVNIAIAFNSVVIGHQLIDELKVGQVNRLAMQQAIAGLKRKPDYILIDGRIKLALNIPQRTIIGGDGKASCIAAASIVAKVTRDRLMDEYHQLYPQYRFDRHRGYGTPEHLALIRKYGLSPIHRRSFKTS